MSPAGWLYVKDVYFYELRAGFSDDTVMITDHDRTGQESTFRCRFRSN